MINDVTDLVTRPHAYRSTLVTYSSEALFYLKGLWTLRIRDTGIQKSHGNPWCDITWH